MKQKGALFIFLAAVLTQTVMADSNSYDIMPHETAYKIVLWNNGDPGSAVTVSNLYTQLTTNGVGDHPQCTVQVFKEKRGNDTYWTISVVPKSSWGVFEVDYPLLSIPRLTNECLVDFKRCGERIPIAKLGSNQQGIEMLPAWAYRLECEELPEFQNKYCLYFGRYPSSEVFGQMIAYENDYQGCMIWTPDNECRVKDFVFSVDLDSQSDTLPAAPQALCAYVVHFPENTGQSGTGFQSPYPVVTSPYAGGWHQAAMKYRDWAAKQWWCRSGKLYDRPGTPAWLKDTHVWSAGGWYGSTQGLVNLINIRDQIIPEKRLGIQFQAGCKYFATAQTAAPDQLPPDDIPGFMWSLGCRDIGIHSSPYNLIVGAVTCHTNFFVNITNSIACKQNGAWYDTFYQTDFNYFMGEGWLTNQDNHLPEGFKELGWAVLDYKDALLTAWSGPLDMNLVNEMAYFPMPASPLQTQQWALVTYWGGDTNVINNLKFYTLATRPCLGHATFLDYLLWVLDEYFGTYGTDGLYLDTFPQSPYPCYDPNHGHALGYGRYITSNQHDLIRLTVEQYSNAVISCESGAGEYLLDSMALTYFKGVWSEYAIPFFAGVYQGYMEYNSWPIYPPYSNIVDFTSSLAFSTHAGYMPGGAVGGGVLGSLWLYSPGSDAVQFFNRTIEMRNQYRDYLAAGTRLQDPVAQVPSPVTVKWSVSWGSQYYYTRQLSPVQVSKWVKNGDPRKVLLLLSNFSSSQQSATVEGRTVTVEAYSWVGIEKDQDKLYFDVGGPEDTAAACSNRFPGVALDLTADGGWSSPSSVDGYSVRTGSGTNAFYAVLPYSEKSLLDYSRPEISVFYKNSTAGAVISQYCGAAVGWTNIGIMTTSNGQWRTQSFTLDPRLYDYLPTSGGKQVRLRFSKPVTLAALGLNQGNPETVFFDMGGPEDKGTILDSIPGFGVYTSSPGWSAQSDVDGYSVRVDNGRTVKNGLYGWSSFYANIPAGRQAEYTNAQVAVLYKTSTNSALWQYCGASAGWVSIGNLVSNGQWQVQRVPIDNRFYDYQGGYTGVNILMSFTGVPITIGGLWLIKAETNAVLFDVGGPGDTSNSFSVIPGFTIIVPPLAASGWQAPTNVDNYTARVDIGRVTNQGVYGWSPFCANLSTSLSTPTNEEEWINSDVEVSVRYKTSAANPVLWQYCGLTNGSWVRILPLTGDGNWHIQSTRLDSRLNDYYGGYSGINVLLTFTGVPITVADLWVDP